MALFELFTASARTRIIRVNLLHLAYLRCLRRRGVTVGPGYLRCRLSFNLLLYANVEQNTDCLLGDGSRHGLEHLVGIHLILNNRISLAVSLQADTLTQLVHVIDMAHPLVVDHLQKYHTLQLTDLLCILEFSLLRLIQLDGFFLQHVL